MAAPHPSTTPTLRTRFGGALALIPVGLTAYIHYMITRGCFRADDFLNLYQINNYSLPQYLIIPNAGHLLLARNLVFYVSWLFFGTHAWPYLWSAFLTHLLNVWLLFLVIDLFTRSRSAATSRQGLLLGCRVRRRGMGRLFPTYQCGRLLCGLRPRHGRHHRPARPVAGRSGGASEHRAE